MSRSTLLLGAWLWACVAASPLVIFLVFFVRSHGGVGPPLNPMALNHALMQWAARIGNNLASQIPGG